MADAGLACMYSLMKHFMEPHTHRMGQPWLSGKTMRGPPCADTDNLWTRFSRTATLLSVASWACRSSSIVPASLLQTSVSELRSTFDESIESARTAATCLAVPLASCNFSSGFANINEFPCRNIGTCPFNREKQGWGTPAYPADVKGAHKKPKT